MISGRRKEDWRGLKTFRQLVTPHAVPRQYAELTSLVGETLHQKKNTSETFAGVV